MENIIEVENLKDLKGKKLYSGRNGTCYLTNNESVFKAIDSPNEEALSKLTKYDSAHFVFPKTLVYSKNGKLLGYIMDYVDGKTIKNIDDGFSLDKYTEEIVRIENEIATLTNYKLHIVDCGVNNIMVSSDEKIRIIDTDFYETNSSLKNLYQVNMTNFNYSIMYPIHDLAYHDFTSEQLNKYSMYTIDGKMKASDFIYELGGEIYLLGSYPENTIGDFKNQVKKLRR